MTRPEAGMGERDLSVDFYRVSAIGLVVVGHWLVANATYSDGEFGMLNVLEEMPWTQWLTLFTVGAALVALTPADRERTTGGR
ncbi:hypothetical protein H7I77_21585 [Mycolicibacterium novocastrense]|uniref:Acyltransferase n=2 Tax=Mycolicibacterium novocastrense TaxID=59813 RepID=A0AAW5SQQ9_MYCNV|nr:hypothetical protein [Mycolicibacterium novocastrense]MCV7025910.1 hypothetical protein [Mycolicibacterium novocastrense]